jgi:putative ABC transport system substrate-binding protein
MQTRKGRGIVRSTVSQLAMVLALLLLAAPLAAQAPQVGKVYRVGFLTGYWVPELFNAFRQGMLDLGWREGQNLVLEARSADGKIERIPALATELVRLKVDVIVVSATAVNEAKRAIAGTPTVSAALAYGIVEVLGSLLIALWWGRPPMKRRILGLPRKHSQA